MEHRQYKVISISEGGCGTVLLGAAAVPIKKLEEALNQEAAAGWQLHFMVIEHRRFLLFWTRETVIITLVR